MITSSIYTNIKTTLLLVVVLFMSTNVLRAQEHHETSPAATTTATTEQDTEANATKEHGTEEHAGHEPFNIKEEAMHHIADANQWHTIFGYAPLPVIIYNRTSGTWLVGLSSMFHHEEVVKGFVMHHDRIVPANGTDAYLDLSITKNVFTMLLASFILLVVFISVAKACQNNKGKAPKGLQNIIEPLVIFVKDEIVQPNLGKNTNKFLPYFLTAFFFIWINNVLGLIPLMPGGANVMGNIAVTLVLSVFTMFIVNGFAKKDYWMHIVNPLGNSMPLVGRILIGIILLPVELLGIISKPIALMLRLFANISAGHIIVISLTSLIFVFGKAVEMHMEGSIGGSTTGAAIAIPFVLFISVIEILVAFLQAFIFTMLSAVFLGLALEEHHHEEHAH